MRIQTSALESPALELAPIPEADVLAGSPVARSCRLSSSAKDDLGSFHWSCTAGRFRWHFSVDEIVHILEGGVTVTGDDGQVVTLGPGDTAHFPCGLTTVWEVPEYVRKFATIRAPAADPLTRAVRLAKRLLRPVREEAPGLATAPRASLAP